MTGTAIALENVDDPVFSTEMMGKGIAIKPKEGIIYAPADGELTVVYDAKHAYGLMTTQGAEVLIHIGIDTVNLNGVGFTTQRKYGELVKKGDVLGTFDLKALQEAGYDDTVMEIVTNTQAYAAVDVLNKTQVVAGEDLLVVSEVQR